MRLTALGSESGWLQRWQHGSGEERPAGRVPPAAEQARDLGADHHPRDQQ